MSQTNTRLDDAGNGGVAGAIDSVPGKAKELASNASEFVGHTKDKVKQWAHDARENINEAASATGEMAHNAKDRAQELTANAIHQASEVVSTAGEEVTRAIRKYPIQSVLLGAALGYLLVKATTKG